MIKYFRYVFIVCVLFAVKTNAQVNLVPNPSFENYIPCAPIPHPAGIFSALYWEQVNSPDYFNNIYGSFCPYGDPIPLNNFGYQYPHTGNAYAGFVTAGYDPGFFNYREWLDVKLKDSLKSGKKYCVSFYYVKGNTSQFAIDRLGAYISKTGIDTSHHSFVQYNPQVFTPINQFLTDTINWQPLKGTYTAIGGEKYISLGNFFDSTNTDTFFVYGNHQPGIQYEAYYYIDDISLLSIDTVAYAGSDKTICAGDKVFIGRKQEVGLECTWYDLSGNQLSDSAGWFAQPTQTTSYIVKMDNCNISYDTVTITVTPNVKGKISITASPQNVCPNQIIQLQTTATNSVGLQYNWQPLNLVSNSTIPNPTASPSASTSFQLITTPSSMSIYCGADTSKVFVRVISTQPQANAGADTTICEGKTAHIGSNNNLCSWCTYTWFPATGLQNPNAAYTSVSLSYTTSQTYILSKKDSCQTTTDKVNLLVKDCTPDSVIITVPNIFTPNNDGKNDAWNMLIEGRGLIFDLQTTIYNRWGKTVFESTNINQNWNGNNLYSGIPCSADTYFYIISYTDGNTNEARTLKGFLELVR